MKKNRKILFLDIDGVLNCEGTFTNHRGTIGIDPYMAFLVGKILMNTGAELVLSSSWRGYTEGEEEIEKQIAFKISDRTPHLSGTRGEEIQAWLEENEDTGVYAILDDDSDMLKEQTPNFFQTSWKTGITEEIADAVTNHLVLK